MPGGRDDTPVTIRLVQNKAAEGKTSYDVARVNHLVLESRFGDKPVEFQVVCPQNGTAVLKGLSWKVKVMTTKISILPIS